MKHLKNIIILFSCLFLAPSVEAVFFEEASVEERLGRAVCVVLDRTSTSSFEENREDHVVAEKLFSRALSSTEDASSNQELATIFTKIGSKYVEDPSPVLRALEDLAQSEAAMYHRAHLLLDGIGVTEGEEDQAKAKAFALIRTTLEANSDNDVMRALLFRYFLPSRNPLALAHFGNLVIKIASDDKIAASIGVSITYRECRTESQLLQEANKALGLNFDLIRVERRNHLEAIEKQATEKRVRRTEEETQAASTSSSSEANSTVR